MKLLILSIFLFITIACSSSRNIKRHISQSSQKITQKIDDLAGDGKPNHLGLALDEDSYVEFEAKRLKNAKVLWVNFDLLREMGVEFPSSGLTPEFEEAILDQFAYMVPNENDTVDSFSETVKTFYADRYGGWGIGFNGGSGRAGIRGQIQIKNIGQTPLIGDQTPFAHKHGGGSIKEAVQEAVWGETLHKELPHGANRILFILDTGTYTHWPDGTKERRSLIIRENPLRPAHYMTALTYRPKQGQKMEFGRVSKVVKKMIVGLKQEGIEGETLQELIEEMYRRQAQQIGVAFARGFFHGGLAPSNILLSGGYLDYASVTSVPGYFKHKADEILFPTFDAEIRNIKVSYDFLLKDLRKHINAKKLESFPTVKFFNIKIDNWYRTYRNREFLRMIGIPLDIVHELSTTAQSKDMINAIETFLKYDLKKTVVHTDDFETLKRVLDFQMITATLLQNDSITPEAFIAKLEDQSVTIEDAEKMIESFKAYWTIVVDRAGDKGIDKDNLIKLVLLRNKKLNQRRKGLYREAMKQKIVADVSQYLESGSRDNFWQSLDALIRENKRGHYDEYEQEIIINERLDKLSGSSEKIIFDAKSNKLYLKISVPREEEQVNFRGRTLSAKEFENMALRFSTTGWKEYEDVLPIQSQFEYSFEIELNSRTSKIEYVIGSDESGVWWNENGSNYQVLLKDNPLTPKSTGTCLDNSVDLVP